MVLAALKFYGISLFFNGILLSEGVINWGEFGVLGAVIGSLFLLITYLVKPMVKMMVEDKKSDNEIKKKLADNIGALQLVLSEHIIKSESSFDSMEKSLEKRDAKLQSIDESLKQINSGIQRLHPDGN